MTKRKRENQVEGLISGGDKGKVQKNKPEELQPSKQGPIRQGNNNQKNSKTIINAQRQKFDISDEEHDEAVRLLREVNWGKCLNTSRRNVIRVGDPKTPKNAVGKEYCHSFIFGRNMKDSTGGLSYWSTEYGELYSFFQSLIGRVHPEHPYTNITVNKNLVCKKHTDGGNTGISYIISFGSFTGGRLIIERKGGGDPRPVDIYRKFIAFDGSQQPHETEAYEGERYSAVFYKSNIVPTETAPRKRPSPFAQGAGSGSGGGSGGTGTAEAGSTGSEAMKQRFQEMKKKLQGKGK